MDLSEMREAMEQERMRQEAYSEWWQQEQVAQAQQERRALKPPQESQPEEWLPIFIIGFGMVFLAGIIQIGACAILIHQDLSAITIAWSLSVGFMAYIALLVRLTK
jgi:hypothetical protein